MLEYLADFGHAVLVDIMCTKCLDFGFRMPIRLDRLYSDLLPFSVLFRDGYACDCPNGNWFLLRRAEWLGLSVVADNSAANIPITAFTVTAEDGQPTTNLSLPPKGLISFYGAGCR